MVKKLLCKQENTHSSSVNTLSHQQSSLCLLMSTAQRLTCGTVVSYVEYFTVHIILDCSTDHQQTVLMSD